MSQPLLVSIIINNYNYGRFIAQAIDSALQQDYPSVEVIVVDDGSTDDSHAVIARYEGQVISVFKQNGGQASAFNAGFASSHGGVIIFLDSDDCLAPGIARRAVEVLQANPGAVKVHYRLAIVDSGGARTGLTQPPIQRALPGGDLRRQVLTFPDDIPWQPTSGNAFRAGVLRNIFPVPEEVYRICADYYLANLPPLFGEVVALDEIGGVYSVRGSNNHHPQQINLEQPRQVITRTCHTHVFMSRSAEALGLAGFPAEPSDGRSVSFLANRMVSHKLDPQQHPIAKDRSAALLWRGVRASFGRFDLPLFERLIRSMWFLGVFLAPRPVVKRLAQRFFHPKQAGHRFRVASLLQRFKSRYSLRQHCWRR